MFAPFLWVVFDVPGVFWGCYRCQTEAFNCSFRQAEAKSSENGEEKKVKSKASRSTRRTTKPTGVEEAKEDDTVAAEEDSRRSKRSARKAASSSNAAENDDGDAEKGKGDSNEKDEEAEDDESGKGSVENRVSEEEKQQEKLDFKGESSLPDKTRVTENIPEKRAEEDKADVDSTEKKEGPGEKQSVEDGETSEKAETASGKSADKDSVDGSKTQKESKAEKPTSLVWVESITDKYPPLKRDIKPKPTPPASRAKHKGKLEKTFTHKGVTHTQPTLRLKRVKISTVETKSSEKAEKAETSIDKVWADETADPDESLNLLIESSLEEPVSSDFLGENSAEDDSGETKQKSKTAASDDKENKADTEKEDDVESSDGHLWSYKKVSEDIALESEEETKNVKGGRGRGRPPKRKATDEETPQNTPDVKKRRGRPKLKKDTSEEPTEKLKEAGGARNKRQKAEKTKDEDEKSEETDEKSEKKEGSIGDMDSNWEDNGGLFVGKDDKFKQKEEEDSDDDVLLSDLLPKQSSVKDDAVPSDTESKPKGGIKSGRKAQAAKSKQNTPSRGKKKNPKIENHMSPVVKIKRLALPDTKAKRLKSFGVKKPLSPGDLRIIKTKPSGTKVKRRIAQGSNVDIDKDPFGVNEESIIDREVENITPLSVTESDFVDQKFGIDSDSDDESFAPMQAAVDSLLSTNSVLVDDKSPSASPRAKDGTPGKRGRRRKMSGRKASAPGDSEPTGKAAKRDEPSESYQKPKTSEQLFDELMGATLTNGVDKSSPPKKDESTDTPQKKKTSEELFAEAMGEV